MGKLHRIKNNTVKNRIKISRLCKIQFSKKKLSSEMCDSEFTYVDFEESSTSEEDREEPFVIDETALANAWLLLNEESEDHDYDDNYEDDENSNEESDDDEDLCITVEDTSIKSPDLKPLTSCVVIDIIEGEIKRCNSKTNLRPLKQMIGTWEVDADTVKDIKDSNHQPGVCFFHFAFDQNQLHTKGAKQLCSIDQNIRFHFCIFCRKKKCFFSRGDSCKEHSWKINEHNIQLPCISIHKCSAFVEGPISQKSSSGYRAHYICSRCFQQQGGHLYIKPGRGKTILSCTEQGKHDNDTKDSLKYIGKWIVSIAESDDQNMQKRLLSLITPALTIFNDETMNKDSPETKVKNLPSKLLVLTALRVGKVELDALMKEKSHIETLEEASMMGEKIGKNVLFSHTKIQENINQLENPSSYESYYNALPGTIRCFFQALITVLQQRKLKMINKKRHQHGLSPKSLDNIQITRATVLLTSMLLTIAFPRTKIWLSRIISSVCQNPKLLPYLREILYSARVISYTKRHENRLENFRMCHSNPRENLIRGSNIWNLAVIDNIDFKASTFPQGNIFDVVRKTSHATLRMVFQFTLPISFNNFVEESTIQPLFGKSSFTDNLLIMYETTLNSMLENNVNEFDMDDVHSKITEQISTDCNTSPPKVVILEPCDPPNCNDNVYAACEMYRDDLSISSNENLYVACDQAIFGRLISYKETHKDVRLLLGQWHTSKDMCSTLITIFSGYGIFNLAATLGARFLDKFEHVVDYRVTCRVLELIWVAVGIALCKNVKKEGKTMNDILNGNNRLIKVWYLFFRWTGYFGAQNEKNRLSMLLAEYTDDVATSQNVRAIKSRKDSLWSLAEKLSDAFNYPDPTTHPLFKGVPELSDVGIANILSLYESGKSRFQKILAQDVYRTEPRIAAGRRERNVKSYTYAQLVEKEKKEKKTNKRVDDPPQASNIQQSVSSIPQQIPLPPETNSLKKIRRTTTEIEKAILEQLFESEKLTETIISEVLLQLQAISLDWTTERIKTYWRNNRCKKPSKVTIEKTLPFKIAVSTRLKNSLPLKEQNGVKTGDSGRRSWDLYLKICHFQTGFT
ncbi:hypothetical protein Glove_290g67 [Diversispora epigaea]|uniref:Uncharacterized protein n=1 Tax=Diversispora epigaea TaxID=1348612 RepID=A0A397I7K3_9GLOM|nr:hypothetical protein Glove_290g67 [Diversispora epigaea]